MLVEVSTEIPFIIIRSYSYYEDITLYKWMGVNLNQVVSGQMNAAKKIIK